MPETKQQTNPAPSRTRREEELKKFDPDTLPKAPKETILAGCNVTVMSGSSSREFPVAKQRIGDVRKLLKTVLNIADDAIALVNGAEVGEDAALEANSRLEFVRRAGSKGFSRKLAAFNEASQWLDR